MADSSRPGGKRSRKTSPPLPTTDELRDLVDRSCRRHEESATQTLDDYGDRLGPVVRQMLEEDLMLHDESRGEFAVWLLAELIIFDLMRHPDEFLLVNWFSIPPYPSCSEEGPEKDWYTVSQSLAEALTMEQITELFLLALQSSCDQVRGRAERAWKVIRHNSGLSYNPRGTTLRRRCDKYRERMVEALRLVVEDEDLANRDAAERALAVIQDDQDDWNRLLSS